MKLVKCIEERANFPGQISKGSRYWIDESSVWKDSDGDEYATFYDFHLLDEKYRLGQFKTSHFKIEHCCTTCIYSKYPKDCKQTCMVLAR